MFIVLYAVERIGCIGDGTWGRKRTVNTSECTLYLTYL